jgi:PAS domain S-box-containing protein
MAEAVVRTERAKLRPDQAERLERAEPRSAQAISVSELRYQRMFEAAEQRLNLLSTCVSNLNDIVMVFEADPIDEPGPKIVFVNEAFERLTGYTSAEALGRSPRFLEGKRTDHRILAEIQQALATRRPIRRQLMNYRKDGAEYCLDIDINPIFDSAGDCTHFAAIARDITESKKVAGRFRLLVDSNGQGVFFWNAKGQITGANDAFLRLVRYTREDLKGGRVCLSAMTPPEYAELDRRALKEIAATGDCLPYEKELVRLDGSRVSVLVSAAALEDNPEEGVCYILDLTERKKLEHHFLRAQRMEGIGALAGGIAHDLNNILSPIMMAIGILKLSAADRQTKDILETIEVSAKRGSDIVRQVLSFARGLDGERIAVQFKHLLKDLETIIKDTFPKNIRLELHIPHEPWMILGDPTQLHQILLNLCVNARDAMPEGGRLTLTVENTMMDEHYAAMHAHAKAGPYLTINVSDTGTGIPPAILNKIFEPFFTTKELGKGTGLGLSTVRAIVKSHGGFIDVYSQPGAGATFKVLLPAIESSSGARKNEAGSLGPVRGRGEMILVVDDEAAIRTITTQTLETFGYRTLTAIDGAEAVAIYAMNRAEISVVLTDLAMPIMDGPATIRALTKIDPTVKIIAVSGFNTSGGVTRISGSVVKQFLTKPYTAERSWTKSDLGPVDCFFRVARSTRMM